jgi:uncharacterized membrane protein
MKQGIWRVTLGMALMLALLAVQGWAAGKDSFQKIDVQRDGVQAVVTIASGINNDGYIVGWYCFKTPCGGGAGTESDPRVRGFIRAPDGTFQYVDINDCTPTHTDCNHAVGTQPRYISPQGLVVGAYFTLDRDPNGKLRAGNPRFRGFACIVATCSGPDQQIVYFDPPSEIYDNQDDPVHGLYFDHSIIPRGINAEGDIVGCIHDKDQMTTMHGFRLHDGVFSRNTDAMTMNNGINPKGEVVGLDFMNLTGYRLDRSGNVIERISFAGTDETDAWDINARGEIVGQAFTNNFAVGHAFLRDKHGNYAFIDPPDASSANCQNTLSCSSTAFAVADNGNIVGQYRDLAGPACSTTACVHGFLLQRAEE